jgi:hypothetical protein
MEWHAVADWVGRHKYLALASVFALMAGQEIFEILVLEQSSEQVARFPLGVVLHLAQILAIVVGT